MLGKIILSLSLSSFSLSLVAQKNKSARPNIVFILADDLGYGDVKSFNPNGKIPTPNIDKLSEEGIQFTNAHSSSSVCTPSRYSILTGRYPWRSRLQKGVLNGYDSSLIRNKLTIAQLLKDNGYYTACVGKWHLGMGWTLKPDSSKIKTGWEIDYSKSINDGPIQKGFDYFYGISASLDMPPFVFIENDHTTEIPTVTKKWGRSGPAGKDFDAIDVLPKIISKSKEIIELQSKKQNPFFLYLALPSPHTPILPNQQFKDKSGVTEYGDYVMETDWAVGQVAHTIDSLHLGDNTLIVFTSDNGFAPYVLKTYDVEKLGHEPSYVFRGYKSDIWDGGHRIPLVIKWPTLISKHSTSDNLVSLADFMATFSEILGKKLPQDAGEDSYSLLPFLSGNKRSQNRTDVVYQSIDGSFSIQEKEWKLILCPGSGGWEKPTNKDALQDKLPSVQLYNMYNDIGESKNVAQEYPKIVQSLTQKITSYINNGRSTSGPLLKNEVNVVLEKNK